MQKIPRKLRPKPLPSRDFCGVRTAAEAAAFPLRLRVSPAPVAFRSFDLPARLRALRPSSCRPTSRSSGPPRSPKRSWPRASLAAVPARHLPPEGDLRPGPSAEASVPKPLGVALCRFRPKYRSAPRPAEAERQFLPALRRSGPILRPEGLRTPSPSRSPEPVPGCGVSFPKSPPFPGNVRFPGRCRRERTHER